MSITTAQALSSADYRGTVCVLVYNDGTPANVGDDVTARIFRPTEGTRYVLSDGRAPHKPGSSGKVYVKAYRGDNVGVSEYYPSVIKAKWQPAA